MIIIIITRSIRNFTQKTVHVVTHDTFVKPLLKVSVVAAAVVDDHAARGYVVRVTATIAHASEADDGFNRFPV
jgi:hypothetical protein